MDKMITQKEIKNYSIYIFKDKNEISLNLANFIEKEINQSFREKNRCQFCVCGGSTPKSVYNLLSKKELPWERVDVFLGDERFVSPKSEDSNSLMLRKSLLNDFGSKASFYEIFNEGFINENMAKDNFKKELLKKCSGNPPVFDLTLLGLGDDGHTASLFPYKTNNSSEDLIIYSYGNGLKRITLTPKILSLSKKVVFLVCGSTKQTALKRLLDSNESSERTPAKLINPNSQILVFTDFEASKDLVI
tara:strand:+ start:14587 stop:15327 length:741 start_codon:yes stop_codon:yes gene_type:complete